MERCTPERSYRGRVWQNDVSIATHLAEDRRHGQANVQSAATASGRPPVLSILSFIGFRSPRYGAFHALLAPGHRAARGAAARSHPGRSFVGAVDGACPASDAARSAAGATTAAPWPGAGASPTEALLKERFAVVRSNSANFFAGIGPSMRPWPSLLPAWAAHKSPVPLPGGLGH